MKTPLILLALLTSGCCDNAGIDVAYGFAANQCEIPDPTRSTTISTDDVPGDSEGETLVTGTGSSTTGMAIGKDCCEVHGVINGGTCLASESPFCFDCAGDPVLCMTHGCAEPNAEDCCLSDDGETVACTPG